MRRAPWVLAGTGAGLLALLGYHTASLSATGAAAPVANTAPTTEPPTTGVTGTTPSTGATSSGAPTSTSTTPTTTVSTRQANGQDVPYRYGELEVKVIAKGNRITNVETVMDQSFDPRSQQINDEAVPILRQQALSAQSANIDGVSGATYTSAAYQESLQAALDALHLG